MIAVLMACIWLPAYHRLERKIRKERTAETSAASTSKAVTAPVAQTFAKGLLGLLAIIMLGIVMQGILRDGITTWMPSYIDDSFHLGSRVSILTGVILPIFSIISVQAVEVVNRKMIRNELACGAFFFGIGMASLLVLSLAQTMPGKLSVLLSVGAFAIASACMHGVNLVLICMVPKFFQYTGRISLISGVLNACTYVGSALSTYGVAVLAENFGWSFTVRIWIVVAAVGTAACAFTIGAWNKFKKRTNQ
jgi:OPA family glycerol-3-phosphate transporter-like MFS transporter